MAIRGGGGEVGGVVVQEIEREWEEEGRCVCSRLSVGLRVSQE